jgi:AhpD family alkylhydroperoxidase
MESSETSAGTLREERVAGQLVSRIPPERLSPAMYAMWEAAPRPGLKEFVQVMAHAERFHRDFSELYAAVRFENHLGPKLTELVRLAVANTTRCPVCMAGRHPGAVAEGMTEEQVCQLDDPARGDFSDAERAAIVFAAKFGGDHLSVDGSDVEALRAHFSEEQIVELGILCALCLGYGRFSAINGVSDDVSG